MNDRYHIISKERESGKDTIYFEPIINPPKSLFVLDITDDYNHWLNKGYAIYFNLGEKKILKK